ncbi:MAG: MMPL family transporter [Myxococcota bacterium]|nr:MMPL family transporter [Myxococcota bacterium]
MAKNKAQRSRIPLALTALGLRRPGTTIAVWALLTLLALPGLLELKVDTSTDSVLDRHHPAWQVYQQSQDDFGGDEIIVVALEAEHPFDPELLAQVRRLGERFENLEGVRRVDSIGTVPVVFVNAQGDLELEPALNDSIGGPDERSRRVSQRLASDRIAPRSLVANEGRILAINLILERGAESRHAELLAEIHELVDPAGGILSGVPVFRVAANDRTRTEIVYFAPITGLLIALFLFALFRSAVAIVLGLIPGTLGSLFLLSAMGYLGAPLGITTMVLPSIILALGCAYSMHFLVAAGAAEEGDSPSASTPLGDALARVSLPVALSGLTTALGLLAITFVRIEAVRMTGGFGALGVLIVTALCLTLLPAGLALSPGLRGRPRGFSWVQTQLAPALLGPIGRRPGVVLALWAGVLVLALPGIARVDVETDATRWLPTGNPVRDAYEEIRQNLSGISPMNVIVTAPRGQSVLEPETLSAVDGLTRHLESLPEVGKALSVADPLRQIHGGFQDDPTQPLPGSMALAEQYLLLLESLEQLEDLLLFDRSATNILIRADNNGSAHLTGIRDSAETWWARHGPEGHTLATTGIMYEFARAEDEIAYGQLRGLVVALLAISGVLLLIFRSPRLALLSLIPNAIPLWLIFGALGLFRMPLDAGTALIGCLALGVAVDDTIHVVSGFHARTESGASPRRALDETFQEVLPAIASTTVMIAGAFLVLGFSEFSIARNLGLLTSGIMVLCFLADTSLLPALLVRRSPSTDA